MITSIINDRFSLLTSFKITVPKTYNHATQLGAFASLYAKKEKFYYYNNAISDNNFANATRKLIPRKVYMVKLFGINSGEEVSSEDCLAFLVTQGAILVGAQGISLVYQLAKERFPTTKWTLSFDEKNALWKGASGGRRVPFMYRDLDGTWYFHLENFVNKWLDIRCLLYICATWAFRRPSRLEFLFLNFQDLFLKRFFFYIIFFVIVSK